MELVKPDEKYLSSYAEAVEEDLIHKSDAVRAFGDPDTIIEKSYRYEHGIDLKPGYVKATTLWLIDQGKFIGEIGIRHELTPALLRFGGNIGYKVRWSERGKGYGAKMLRMALQYCKSALGLRRVLITCDDDNIASIKVIERNGGMLEDRVTNRLERGIVTTRRYWIEIER